MKKVFFFFAATMLALSTISVTAQPIPTGTSPNYIQVTDQWTSNRVTQSLPSTTQLAATMVTNVGPDTLYITGISVNPILNGVGTPDSAKIASAISAINISTPIGWPQIAHLQTFVGWGWNVSGIGFGVVNIGRPEQGQILAPGQSTYINVSGTVASDADSSGINSILFGIGVTATTSLTDSNAISGSSTVWTHQTFLKRSLDITKKPGVANQVLTASATVARHTLLGTFNVINQSPGSIELNGANGVLQGSIAGNTPTVDSVELVDRNGHVVGQGNVYNGNQLYINFSSQFYINAGDTETFQIFGDLPAMSAGDEVSLAISFNGTIQNYYPWGIDQPTYVTTGHEAVGQQTIVEVATTGITETASSTIKVINTGAIASFDSPDQFELTVYDALGQVVLKETAHQSVNLSNLPNGVYEYHITSGREVRNGKFCISK